MEGLLKLIKTRRSIRKFKNKPIPRHDILKILESAAAAPSGSNQQNWHFIVVKRREVKEKMRQAVEAAVEDILSSVSSKRAAEEIKSYSRYFTFFSEAPVVICAVSKPYDSLTGRLLEKYKPQTKHGSTAGIQAVAAAIENLLLAAHAIGYGTCWMTGPLVAKEALEKLLKIMPPDNLLALIPMGIPDHLPTTPPRKPVEKIVTFIS